MALLDKELFFMESILVEGSGAQAEWKRLLEQTPGAPCQLSLQWRDAVREAYPKLENAYYLLEQKGEAKMGLASLYCESLLFGDRVISLPFVDHAGFVGTPSALGAASLFSHVRSRFATNKLECRLAEYSPHFKASENALLSYGFAKQLSRQVAVLQLTDENSVWEGFSRHVRKNVNKAERSGLEVKPMDSQKELSAFYDLYFETMKGFGTPAHSKKYFQSLLSHLGAGKMFHGFNCYFQERLAASLVMLSHGKTVVLPYNVSRSEFREYRPNDLLHWEAIKKAIEIGASNFDLGLAQAGAPAGTHAHGMLEFKLKLGCKLYPRPSYYFGHGKKFEQKIASGNFGSASASVQSGKFAHLRKVWKFLPNSALKKLGPWIARQLCA